jgi:hypothetical protein
MSTDYYFKIKKSKEIKDKIRQLLKDENINHLIDSMPEDDVWVFRERINIGSIKQGYKPLFYNSTYYSSVKEMIQFYNDNKDNLVIIDEHSNEIALSELKELMINKTEGKPNEFHEEEGSIFSEFLTQTIYEDEDGYQFKHLEYVD